MREYSKFNKNVAIWFESYFLEIFVKFIQNKVKLIKIYSKLIEVLKKFYHNLSGRLFKNLIEKLQFKLEVRIYLQFNYNLEIYSKLNENYKICSKYIEI